MSNVHRLVTAFLLVVASLALLVLLPAHAVAHPPSGIVVDKKGTVYYLRSGPGGQIVRVGRDGVVSIIDPAPKRRRPPDAHKLAIDENANLYLRGWGDIWRVSPEENVSIFLSQTLDAVRPGTAAKKSKTIKAHVHWNTPLAFDSKGNLYCLNAGGRDEDVWEILRINPKGQARVLAGGKPGHRDGNGANAGFGSMLDVDIALGRGDVLYLTASGSRPTGTYIRRITPDGEVTTIAGSSEAGYRDGKGSQARFNGAVGLTVDGDGNIYVADSRNRRVRKITPEGIVSTLAGSGAEGIADGPALQATFSRPTGVALGPENDLYVPDEAYKYGLRVRKLTPAGEVTTIAVKKYENQRENQENQRGRGENESASSNSAAASIAPAKPQAISMLFAKPPWSELPRTKLPIEVKPAARAVDFLLPVTVTNSSSQPVRARAWPTSGTAVCGPRPTCTRR